MMNTLFMIQNAFMSVFEKGGTVLILFFFLYLLVAFLASEKYFYFKYHFKKDFEQFKQNTLAITAPNDFLFDAKLMMEASRLKVKVNRNFEVLKMLVAVCPLMGLLGTVTGMVGVFDILAISGSNDARAMASGISRATVPTMAGMLGALCGLLVVKFLKDDSLKAILDINDYLVKFDLKRKKIVSAAGRPAPAKS